MTGVAEARARMLQSIAPLKAERVPLWLARGRVLAAPVIAHRAQPPFAASAMDGYALRSADAPGRFRMVGESAAGHGFERPLSAGEAIRISTGAPIPASADTVLIQEDAVFDGETLVAGSVPAGRHIRAAGCDFAAGQTLLAAGRCLDAVAIGLAAAAGAAAVEVAKRPRVAVLCAGDELVALGATPKADQIYDSCSHAITAFAESLGCDVDRRDVLPDDEARIREAAAEAVAAVDLVVFVGAASVGPHDHARSSFERLGARVLVQKIDMRPGRPTWFATTQAAPVLGLPGNPASALVAAELFLRPIVNTLQGRDAILTPLPARTTVRLPENGPREAYLRARTKVAANGGCEIAPLWDQDSSLFSVFAEADALLVRSAHAVAVEAGMAVEYLPLGAP